MLGPAPTQGSQVMPASEPSSRDSAALVGWDAATSYLGFDGHSTRLYLRAAQEQVAQGRAVSRTIHKPRSTQ
jgi:hypothetical protein